MYSVFLLVFLFCQLYFTMYFSKTVSYLPFEELSRVVDMRGLWQFLLVLYSLLVERKIHCRGHGSCG
jgi:hypothetical protein